MEEIMAMNWKCYDCNMTFTNPNLLQKHKSRFCVGGQLGDPDYLMLRKGFYEDRPRKDTEAPEYERDLERNLYGHPRRKYDKEDHPRYNPNADPKVQQLAETHGRQMQYLSDRNKDLERQKEEIRRRLEELGKRPVKDDDSMNALLQELRAQEARNQRLLEELRRQLMDARHIPQADGKKPPFIYPVYYGNSLVAEITAMRQAYLQNGGNDPDILHQLAQMQAEAQAIDDSLRNRPAQGKSKRDPDNLHALELENERLKRQLLLLQEQNVAAKGRRKGDREGRRTHPGGARTLITENADGAKLDILTTPVEPLNFNEEYWNKDSKTKKSKKDFISPRRAWVDHFDPVKVRIDKDVGNTAFKVSGRIWGGEEEEPEEEVTDKSQIKMATLLNEPTEDIVTNVPNKPPEKSSAKTIKKSSPYHRHHFATRQLKSEQKLLRENYLRTSQANLRSTDIERLDLLSSIKEISRTNTAASDNEYIPISQRNNTENDNGLNQPSHPQLLIESNPPA